MTKSPLLCSAILILSLSTAQAGIPAYCVDEAAQAEWESLLSRYPSDVQLKELYRLKVTICRQIEGGQVSVEDGNSRFEAARQRLIERWEEDNRERGPSGSTNG